MKIIKTEDAVGNILAHDITKIIPGKYKGAAFKKGQLITKQDIPELLKIGKKNLYIHDIPKTHIHEDEAALYIAETIVGHGKKFLKWTTPCEGKTNIISTVDGLLKIDTKVLRALNLIDNIAIATLKTDTPCRKDQPVAATRIIPLTIDASIIKNLNTITDPNTPIIQVLPYRSLRFGAVVTGSEIYNGLIKDGFDEFVGDKITTYGGDLIKKIIVPDDADAISRAILELKDAGCELVITTGGLSVDPDDVTQNGIRQAGAKIISYGSPIMPGTMFLNAELDGTTIFGLPACVYYHKITVLDLILPQFLAGQKITRETIADMGHGGLCMNCPVCHYPACTFGR